MRLKYYDYRNAGYYFITAVTRNREHSFGKIESLEMILYASGNIAVDELLKCAELRENVFIDEYIVMPDHVHFILILTGSDSACSGENGNDNYFHQYHQSRVLSRQ